MKFIKGNAKSCIRRSNPMHWQTPGDDHLVSSLVEKALVENMLPTRH